VTPRTIVLPSSGGREIGWIELIAGDIPDTTNQILLG
jgi:hypothetical protein